MRVAAHRGGVQGRGPVLVLGVHLGVAHLDQHARHVVVPVVRAHVQRRRLLDLPTTNNIMLLLQPLCVCNDVQAADRPVWRRPRSPS